MIKKTVTYTDFDGVEQTETLYFNLNKSEFLDLLDFQDKLIQLQETFSDPDARPDTRDVREFFDFVKTLVTKAHGVRSEDGKRFIKTPTSAEEFGQTPAFEQFIWELFDDVASLLTFLNDIVPVDLAERAQAAQSAENSVDAIRRIQPQDRLPKREAPKLEVAPPLLEVEEPSREDKLALLEQLKRDLEQD